ncbi:MAG: pyridoxal 5'-phosphate synthase glutaminase subunit PdxT [Deinococcales bacterium]
MGKHLGVLALQGAFREHRQMLEPLNTQVHEVRLPQDLKGLSGLIIPGGESTTMVKLIKAYGFDTALPDFYESGAAIWGTCAGAIVLAKEIVGYPEQYRLGLLDITIARNAYGRQVDSFEVDLEAKVLDSPFHAIFIRAPRIMDVGEGVDILASYGENPIWVQQGRLMASVFHPELSHDSRIHQYFLGLCD